MSIPTENQEQRALVKWMSLHPSLRDIFFKINNEGRRTAAQTWNLKCMGLRPGVSDLFIPYPSGKFHGLFLEVKRISGARVSDEQQEWIDKMVALGYEARVCYGWEDGKNIIEEYLSG